MEIQFNVTKEICACCGKPTVGVTVDKVNLCYYCNTSRAICEANAKLVLT